jgi:hypothetical protein
MLALRFAISVNRWYQRTPASTAWTITGQERQNREILVTKEIEIGCERTICIDPPTPTLALALEPLRRYQSLRKLESLQVVPHTMIDITPVDPDE